MLSAVRPKGDFRFILHEDTITVPIFKTLLLRLMVGGGEHAFRKRSAYGLLHLGLVGPYPAALAVGSDALLPGQVQDADLRQLLWRSKLVPPNFRSDFNLNFDPNDAIALDGGLSGAANQS